MGSSFRAVSLLAAALLAATPVAADARPGLGGSMGSRGSHTYMAPPTTRTSPYGAAPFDRSLAPRPGGYGAAAGGYGSAVARHPFASAFAGGLLGFGLGRMLFGHGYAGGGGMGLLGFLIELAILFFVVRWLWRRFFSPNRAMVGGVGAAPFSAGSMFGGGAARGGQVAITPGDYRQFEQGLLDVQQAWTMQDLRALSRFATPEMVANFSDQLNSLSSRNLRNAVSRVRMEQGDLSEAWTENGRDYATVAMRYSMVDVTTDNTGRVVDGSPDERQMVTELWTFVRAQNGGSWLLSAIQQAR